MPLCSWWTPSHHHHYEVDPPQVSNTPGSISKFQIWILDPYFPALPKAIIRWFTFLFYVGIVWSGLDCIVQHNSVKFLPMEKLINIEYGKAWWKSAWPSFIYYTVLTHGMALYGMALYGMALYEMALYGMALYGIVWHAAIFPGPHAPAPWC